jgi:hypothetical protein
MNKRKQRDWKKTDAGWQGFFAGYATAEKDALERSNDRVGHVVAMIRLKISEKKSNEELISFLDLIEVFHA